MANFSPNAELETSRYPCLSSLGEVVENFNTAESTQVVTRFWDGVSLHGRSQSRSSPSCSHTAHASCSKTRALVSTELQHLRD